MAMRTIDLFARAVGLAAAALALAGAARAAPIEITGAGSTFAAPLIDTWIAAQAKVEPNVLLRYSPVGSGEGIRSFLARRVDFAATDRPLAADEEGRAEGGAVQVPFTAGMVVVAYNLPGITGPLRLGRETLAGIFSGAVRDWNDPRIRTDNPGVALPARTIALVTRREGSGTTHAFTAHLAAIDPAWARDGRSVGDRTDWPKGAMAVYGNEGVASRIALTEYSLGYLEYGFARRLGLRTALLRNRDGAFVAASADSGAAALGKTAADMPEDARQSIPDPAGAAAYPIVTYSWMVLRDRNRSTETAAALRAFVAFGLSPAGQAEGARIGYVPLPPEVVQRSEAALANVR